MGTEALDAQRGWRYFAIAVLITIPALLLRVEAFASAVEVETLLFGLAILGAAFLLSWAAEVAQLDISQALAIAFLAFIAVLPEYAVDLVFAWKAGRQDQVIGAFEGKLSSASACGDIPCRELAIANMTGANRLLIGIGWAVVVLLWWKRSKQKEVILPGHNKTEVGFLAVATLWAFSIPIRGELSIVDFVFLGALFGVYVWRAANQESEEPELVGPPLALAALAPARRRTITVLFFLFAAGVILASAEPFAHGLVVTGERFGINKFLLVQWLAPLASEAPEMIIAILFVLRARPAAGLGTLVSSKVNQWTLLIGSIPIVYAIARGSLTAMPMDSRQAEEITLTAAQSLFAVAVLANLSINRLEAAGLLVLFLAQFGVESEASRYVFSAVYVALALGILIRKRENRNALFVALRDVFRSPRRSRT